MAKRPAVALVPSMASSLATPKASAAPAVIQKQEDATPSKGGRPRTLSPGFKTLTLRLSPDTHKALNVLAAQQGKTAKQILFDGLADQFSRYGVTAPVK